VFTAWIKPRSPFTLDGKVKEPLCTEIEVGQRFDLGKGIFGFVLMSPLTGESVVAETSTGMIVGLDIKSVRKAVQCGDEESIRKQLEGGLQRYKCARLVSNDEFWQAIAKLSGE
jgi:hypothetical protein